MSLSPKRPSVEQLQAAENVQTKSVSFVMAEDKYKALKILALNQDKTVKQLLNEAVDHLLAEQKSNQK